MDQRQDQAINVAARSRRKRSATSAAVLLLLLLLLDSSLLPSLYIVEAPPVTTETCATMSRAPSRWTASSQSSRRVMVERTQ